RGSAVVALAVERAERCWANRGDAPAPCSPRRFMNARKPSDPLDDDTRPVPSQDPVNVYAPESDAFSPEDYAVGQVISGRFRVEHVIGIGSMGIVLAARHIELDERVAIKFIRSEMQAVPGVLSRFAREAKAAASIKSEHIA